MMFVNNIDKCRFTSQVICIAGLLLVSPVAGMTQQATSVRWEPFKLEMANATTVEAEVGRFAVPERRDRPTTATIELAFVRLRSRASQPLSPLVYLDGGPGGAGYTAAALPEYTDLFERVRESRDVILLSQRGTGLSRPRPSCPPEGPLPDDFFVSAQTMTRELGRRAERCAAALRQKGLDLDAYNTQEGADDVEDLRKALGLERVSLFGFSYGTHVALAVLRRWPASVERAILAGTEGPGHTWKFPSTMDRQLEKLSTESGADVVGAWKRLLARTEKEPLRVPIVVGDMPRTVLVGPGGLQYMLRRDVGDTNDWPFLPAGIIQADRGELALIGRLVGRRFAGLSSGTSLLAIAMDCASGAASERLSRITREEPAPLFGVMTNYPFPMACELLKLPMLPESFRAPVVSHVPTLFVSGTHDSNTPPSQAEEVAANFTRASHIVVENAGHESTLRPTEVRDAIVAFLRGENVISRRIPTPRITFWPLDYRPR